MSSISPASNMVRFAPPQTRLEKRRADLDSIQQRFQDGASANLTGAQESAAKAGEDAFAAIAHSVGAVVNLGAAVGDVGAGTVLSVLGSADVVEAAFLVTVAGGAYFGEAVQAGVAEAAMDASRGLASFGNAIAELRGDGNQLTAKAIAAGQKKGYKDASEILLGMAKANFSEAGAHFVDAGDAYVNALIDVAGAGANTIYAAAHVAGTLANLVDAAIKTGASGVDVGVAAAIEVAEIGVIAADKGLAGAEAAAFAGAKFTADFANAIKRPNQDGVGYELTDSKVRYATALKSIMNNPANAGKITPDFASRANSFINQYAA